MNFISQATSTSRTGTQEGMHDGEGTTGAWQEGGEGRNARPGTHAGGMAGGRARRGAWQGAWRESDGGAWQGHGGRARQGGMTGGMAGEHDRGMPGGTSSL